MYETCFFFFFFFLSDLANSITSYIPEETQLEFQICLWLKSTKCCLFSKVNKYLCNANIVILISAICFNHFARPHNDFSPFFFPVLPSFIKGF